MNGRRNLLLHRRSHRCAQRVLPLQGNPTDSSIRPTRAKLSTSSSGTSAMRFSHFRWYLGLHRNSPKPARRRHRFIDGSDAYAIGASGAFSPSTWRHIEYRDRVFRLSLPACFAVLYPRRPATAVARLSGTSGLHDSQLYTALALVLRVRYDFEDYFSSRTGRGTERRDSGMGFVGGAAFAVSSGFRLRGRNVRSRGRRIAARLDQASAWDGAHAASKLIRSAQPPLFAHAYDGDGAFTRQARVARKIVADSRRPVELRSPDVEAIAGTWSTPDAPRP